MNDATLGILLTMRDEASPQLKGLGTTLQQNRTSFRELAMGVMFLGSTFMTLGASMKMSNDESLKSIGNVIMMTGAIMTGIASAVQFVKAIGNIINALKALQIEQILTQALTPGIGWATLLAGGAIAAGAVYGISRMSSATATSTPTARAAGTTINQYIQGSVVTQRELVDNVQRALLVKEQRSGNTVGLK